MTRDLAQLDLELPTARGETPTYQRDLIDWLQGFRATDEYIKILKERRFTYAECAAIRDRLKPNLVPKPIHERQVPGRRGR